jgi:hypothetical protein
MTRSGHGARCLTACWISCRAVSDPVRAALQQILDACGDGWTVADYCVVMGLERVNSDGEIETTPWWTAPTQQATWITDGLIIALDRMHAAAVEQD